MIIKLKKVEKLMESGDCEFVGEVVSNNINYGIITRYERKSDFLLAWQLNCRRKEK